MKILVIDNSATIRVMLKDFYKNLGYEVDEAKTSEEAIEFFEYSNYTLVTISQMLTSLTGLMVIEKFREIETLRKDKRITPILMISTNDNIETRVKAFEAGASEFITKPFTFQELNDKSKEAIQPDNIFEGSNILIAEDSEVTRKLIVRIIRTMGGKIIEAENGKRALELFKNNLQEINMVLTDLFMPEMDGIELCKTLRYGMGFKSLPIVFLTGSTETDYIIKVFEAGASDYITKPFVKEELISRITSHLSKFKLLKNLNKNIQELKKLNNLKDDFLKVCTHDLKTPIYSIKGFIENIKNSDNLNDIIKSNINHIEISSNHLNNMINDIFELTNIQLEEGLNLVPLALHDLIKEELDSFRIIAKTKDINLIFDPLDNQKKEILADKLSVFRILQNILSNSFKSTGFGGTIKILLNQDEENLKLEISDNGIGFSKENLDSIFENIVNTDIKSPNILQKNEIGLSLVKKLMARNNGKIDLESEEGKGTKYTLHFQLNKI